MGEDRAVDVASEVCTSAGRREFVRGALALGAGMVLATGVAAQQPGVRPGSYRLPDRTTLH
jgi:hypothetical protein